MLHRRRRRLRCQRLPLQRGVFQGLLYRRHHLWSVLKAGQRGAEQGRLLWWCRGRLRRRDGRLRWLLGLLLLLLLLLRAGAGDQCALDHHCPALLRPRRPVCQQQLGVGGEQLQEGQGWGGRGRISSGRLRQAPARWLPWCKHEARGAAVHHQPPHLGQHVLCTRHPVSHVVEQAVHLDELPPDERIGGAQALALHALLPEEHGVVLGILRWGQCT